MHLPTELSHFRDDRLNGLPIDYVSTNRSEPVGMVILMPSALKASRPDRSKVIFNRATWVDQWPDAQVISFADPVMQLSNELDGAWFIHPHFDVIKAISEITQELAKKFGIVSQRVVFYGTSLGGFGAIGAASHFLGSRAVSEIPQIDFENWNLTARKAVEDHITHMPLSEYRKKRPEQISLIHRIEYAGYIPQFRILTNPTEINFFDQQAFYSWAQLSNLPKGSPLEFFISNEKRGHDHLGKAELIPHVQP